MPPSETNPLSVGDVLDKKFEIESSLGAGLLGPSYLARNLSTGKKVVIKVLPGPAIEPARYQELVARQAQLSGDAFCRVIDAGVKPAPRGGVGKGWLAIEHFEGESLRRLMDRYVSERRSFSLPEAVQIAVKVLEAIEGALKAGLPHRHLKPQNILVYSKQVGPSRDKVVRTLRLSGLGVADAVHPETLQDLLLGAEETRYMAPETSGGFASGGDRSDTYSVGVLFYELLTGETPRGTYLAPSQVREDVPKAIDSIVNLALEAEPGNRYPSPRDMINDLQRAFQAEPEEPPPSTGGSKLLFGLLGGALLIAALGGGAMILFNPTRLNARKDEELRAQLAGENKPPDAALVTQKVAAHPEMIWIPEGTYLAGRMNSEPLTSAIMGEPVAEIRKTGAFYMDRVEWSEGAERKSRVRVSQEEAAAMCASAGKRLCSADEWERVCKGQLNTLYAYGNTYNAETCGGDIPTSDAASNLSALTSGSLSGCVSSFGVFDLSGGVREWTGSEGVKNPKYKIVKGGKRGEPELGSRCAFSGEERTSYADLTLGFRCCLDDGAAAPPTPPTAPPAP